MDHVRPTADRAILDIPLPGPGRDIQRDHDLLAAGIANVGRFVLHGTDSASQMRKHDLGSIRALFSKRRGPITTPPVPHTSPKRKRGEGRARLRVHLATPSLARRASVALALAASVALPRWAHAASEKPLALALEVEQELLPPQPAAIAAELAVLVHHAVAGNHNGDAVEAVGAAHRPHGFGLPQAGGQRLVGACL